MLNIQSSQVPMQRISKKQKPSQNINFGRAETNDERKISNLLMDRTFQINAVDLRAMIMPGAATPAYTIKDKDGNALKVNTGVGSPHSKAAQEHILLAKDIMGINAIQQLPLGEIDAGNYSPFNGSTFVKGAHLIDPGKMMVEMNLVNADDIKAFNVSDEAQPKDQNHYQNFFDKNESFFQKAHSNFKEQLKPGTELEKKYNAFVNHDIYKQWLDKQTTVDVLSKNLYGHDYYLTWQDTTKKANPNCTLELNPALDKILFDAKENSSHPQHEAAKARLAEIEKDKSCQDTADLFKFKQFLAYTQAQETQEFLNNHNIKNIADVPIGVKTSDTYGFQDAFMIDPNAKHSKGVSTLGCDGSDWGAPATKLNDKKASDFVKFKYQNELTTFNTARIDAAWQLKVAHFYNNHDTDKSEKKEALNGDGLFPAVKDAFDASGKSDELKNIVAENLCNDMRTVEPGKILDKMGIPQIVNWRDNPRNYPTTAWATPGIHDDPSILSKNLQREHQIDRFAMYLQGQEGDKGPRKVLFTFADIFGKGQQYNVPGTSGVKSSNWKLRQPENYEETLFKNLAGADGEKKGLNPYKAAKRAMQNKHMIDYKGSEIINNEKTGFAPDAKIVAELLQHFEGVIEQQGVYTTAEAEAKSGELMKDLHTNFGGKAVKLLVEGYDTLANKANNETGLRKLMIKVGKAVEEHRKLPAGTIIETNTEELVNQNQAAQNSAQDSLQNAAEDAAENATKEGGKDVTDAASSGSFKHGKLVAIGVGVAAVGGLATMYYSSQKKAEEAARKKHKTNHKTQYA